MKELKDYLGKKVLIQVNNQEEYEELVPLLNKVYRGWSDSNFKSYMTDAKEGCFWIILDKDMMTRTIHDEDYDSIMQASEFIKPNETVINNYSIY